MSGLVMENYLEIAGFIIGLIYLWLEYKASIYLWVASIIMPAIYLFVYYDAGLYADTVLNIYYLVIAIYGWVAWKYNFTLFGKKSSSKELKISHTPPRRWISLFLLYAVAQVVTSTLLIEFTDSTVPWTNGLTTALSIVGMWMLARKYVEQWLVWLVVDIISAGLYIYKGLYPTAALYMLYTVIAVFGYIKWKKLMKEQDE